MATEEEVWHLVEARRDDGMAAMFRIRDLEPRGDQPQIFVVELPYPITGLSRLPDATSYRRLTQFEEQWLLPACASLGWTFVAAKTEDGSFFLYLYGNADPNELVAKISPFDGSLGFFHEHDPQWDEYAALKELVDQANAMPDEHEHDVHEPTDTELRPAKKQPEKKRKPTAKKQPAPKKKAAPKKKPTAKKKPAPKKKPARRAKKSR